MLGDAHKLAMMATMKIYLRVLFLSVLFTGLSPHSVAASYAALVKLTLSAPVVTKVMVHKQRQPPKEQRSTTPGLIKLIIEADVMAVLKAPDLVPGRITYLWEGPAAANGKVPNYKKQVFMAYLMPDITADTSYKLLNLSAQQPWTDQDEQTLRAIIKEFATDPVASLRRVTGVRNGFINTNEDGNPSDTYFTVQTASGELISLILQGEKVLISNSDSIAEGVPVLPRTLPWFQLACGLPESLPDSALEDQPSPDDATHLRDTYAKILKYLGACDQ